MTQLWIINLEVINNPSKESHAFHLENNLSKEELIKTTKYIIRSRKTDIKSNNDNRDRESKDRDSFKKETPKFGQRNLQNLLKRPHINHSSNPNQEIKIEV